MMVQKCGVCQNEDSKYKCPVCELRYCSLNCFKSHKPSHAEADFPSSNPQASARPIVDRPGTTRRVPKIDFSGFENDPAFKQLLSRYPLLKTQLQLVYGLTLEPGPEDARTWHRQPLYGEPRETRYQNARGRGRGRGGMRGRGDRGGRGRGDHHSSEERQRGEWTQEKGDKDALATIKRMRLGAEDDDRAEGMREFAEICQMRFGSGRDLDKNNA